jgi:hypothetical protein
MRFCRLHVTWLTLIRSLKRPLRQIQQKCMILLEILALNIKERARQGRFRLLTSPKEPCVWLLACPSLVHEVISLCRRSYRVFPKKEGFPLSFSLKQSQGITAIRIHVIYFARIVQSLPMRVWIYFHTRVYIRICHSQNLLVPWLTSAMFRLEHKSLHHLNAGT